MKQQYDKYTTEDHKVWSILFDRQVINLQDKASWSYLEALQNMKSAMSANRVPHFSSIDSWFTTQTGWTIHCVPGLIPVDEFFMLLAEKKFPSSTWLRSIEKLDYLEEPDMFHDTFGHIPLLSLTSYSSFIHQFGLLGKAIMHDSEKLLMLQRLYWFSVEFGLIKEKGLSKIYGAGILSSFGESKYSLTSNAIERVPFEIEKIIDTPFCTSEMQTKYFIIESYEQLNDAVMMLTKKWLS
jgi:phenylalanine-4-hydroxylase